MKHTLKKRVTIKKQICCDNKLISVFYRKTNILNRDELYMIIKSKHSKNLSKGMCVMDSYTIIKDELKKEFGVKVSGRTIMRAYKRRFMKYTLKKRVTISKQIRYDNKLISVFYRETNILDGDELHMIIKSKHSENLSKGIGAMDSYIIIEDELKEEFGVRVSDRTIMRVCK